MELRKFGDGDYNFFDGRGSWWAEPKVSRIDSYDWESFRSGNGPGRFGLSYSLNISVRQMPWPS